MAIPNDDQVALGASYNPEYHGTNGSVKLSFPKAGSAEFYGILVDTFENVSISKIVDVNGGDARGLCTWPGEYTIAGEREQIRSGAKENYYLPIADSRPNLELLGGTSCLRLVWDDNSSDDSPLTAGAVEIASANTKTTVKAGKEIILSAGAYRTPTLLEYSGVGNPKILAANGIKSVIDLPGVGENLQDQMTGSLQYTRSNLTTEEVVFPATVGDEIISNYIAVSGELFPPTRDVSLIHLPI